MVYWLVGLSPHDVPGVWFPSWAIVSHDLPGVLTSWYIVPHDGPGVLTSWVIVTHDVCTMFWTKVRSNYLVMSSKKNQNVINLQPIIYVVLLDLKGLMIIVGNETLSWSQTSPEDFILLHKYMLQGLSCSSYVIKLHSGMHSSMNPRNDVLKHGYKIRSVAILRPDFILRDRERKWKIQHC